MEPVARLPQEKRGLRALLYFQGQRQNLNFLFLTKRIERYREGLPVDFGENFNRVAIRATVENQRRADGIDFMRQ